MDLLIRARLLAIAALTLAANVAVAQYAPPVVITPGFVDISTIGTAVSAAEADDAISVAIPFGTAAPGFTFPYFGVNATSFIVSSNGWISIDVANTSSASANTTMPNTATPQAVIAPFWDDLDNDNSNSGVPNSQVDYFYDVPNGRFIVQWTNVKRWTSVLNGAPGDLNFQIHLYPSGVVEFHYALMREAGASYTVGLENATGTLGLDAIVNGAFPLPRPAGYNGAVSNSALRFTPTTGPVAFINASQFNFLQAAGSCPGVARSVNFNFSNVGGTTLNVTGVTITGSSAFFIDGSVVFPFTVASGTAATLPIVFSPSPAQAGIQTATATINTDGGSLVVPLSGTGLAEGAGYLFRSSLAPSGCETPGVAVPGTSFIPLTGHTRVTTYTSGTGDDGRFALVLNTAFGSAFPSFRFLGADVTTLQLLTNGSVSSSASAATTFYGANTAALPYIQAAAMNLTLNVTGDGSGVGGEPGLYYGLSNVDADPEQELVITWWHAYDLNSGAGPNGQYLTAQLVIDRGARANEEARYEVRFPDGLDANNVPYRQNTTVADGASDVSMENDAVTGIVEPANVEGAIYRFRSGAHNTGVIFSSAPLYAPGGGSSAVRFEAEVQAQATGVAGWRMMGAPVRSATVARLAALNLVQSVTNQYPSFPDDNVYTGYNGSAFVAATSTTTTLTPGLGFLWYLFNLNCDPTGTTAPLCVPGSPPATDGTSRSYSLPMKLEATGAEPAAIALQAYPVTLSNAGDGFNLVANPFRDDLDVSGIANWATGGALASAVPQVWDPNAGGSGSYVAVTGSVSTWQGFFIQNLTTTAAAAALTIPTTARNTSGTFIGRSGLLYTNAVDAVRARTVAPTVAFSLAGSTPVGTSTLDRAATLAFDVDGTDAWDLYDATKLRPLSTAYATVGFQGTDWAGQPVVKAQESRPAEATSFRVPLVIDAVAVQSGLTLAWTGLEELPANWRLSLRDLVTGAVVDLRQASSYSFTHDAVRPEPLAEAEVAVGTTTGAQRLASAAARFELVVETGSVVGTEGEVPATYALDAARPNPTAAATALRFGLPQAGPVSVAVYDLLGRRVATLAEGERAAGWHVAPLDASSLAAGVYVVRMQAGTFTATQRVTVVR